MYDAGHKPLVQPQPPPAGTTTMLTLASNMISAKKKYMFKHGHRCYASYTFDRLQFRTEARRPKVAAAVEVRPYSTAKPAPPPPPRHATACVPSSHSTEIYVFSKAKETDFCLAALLVATARHYNSILSCYLVIRVGE